MENKTEFFWTDELASKWALEQMFLTGVTLEQFKEANTPKHTPQPILITEEGDKKYKGDKVWWVIEGGYYNMGEWVIDNNAVSKTSKYFSTEIAAKGYQLLARLRSLHEQGLKYINEYNK